MQTLTNVTHTQEQNKRNTESINGIGILLHENITEKTRNTSKIHDQHVQ